MKNTYSGVLLGWLLLGVSALAAAQEQKPATEPTTPPAPVIAASPAPEPAAAAAKPTLEGLWKSTLPLPGGSTFMTISITEPVGAPRTAMLDIPMQHLLRSPMEVEEHGDTLIFNARQADVKLLAVRSADGRQLVGTWQQPGARVPATLSYVVGPQSSSRGVKFPPPYRVEDVAVSNPADNTRLRGTLTVPTGNGPFPAVVLLSDMGPQDRDATFGAYRMFGELADYLTRQGTAVLRLDDRGVGESGGSHINTPTPDLVKDAQAGINFLRTRPLIDYTHIGLIGHGEGGNVALLAAAQPLPPAFVVALATSGLVGSEQLALRQAELRRASEADTTKEASDAQKMLQADIQRQADKMRAEGANAAQVETFLEQQRMRQRIEDKKQLETILKQQRSMLEVVRQTSNNAQAQAIVANMLRQYSKGMDNTTAQTTALQMTTPWYRSFLSFDPQKELAKVQCPVLLINGTLDPQVNASNLALLEKGLRASKRVVSRKLTGVNHQLQAPEQEWPLLAGVPRPMFSPLAQEAIRDFIRQLYPN